MGRLCYPTHPGRKAVSRNRGTKFLRPGKEGMARVFAVQVQCLLHAGAIQVQGLSEPQIYPRLQILLLALAQCRGTICHGAGNLSRYIGF
jgi:hypothetical protein